MFQTACLYVRRNVTSDSTTHVVNHSALFLLIQVIVECQGVTEDQTERFFEAIVIVVNVSFSVGNYKVT